MKRNKEPRPRLGGEARPPRERELPEKILATFGVLEHAFVGREADRTFATEARSVFRLSQEMPSMASHGWSVADDDGFVSRRALGEVRELAIHVD
jgi:hypothetical protein